MNLLKSRKFWLSLVAGLTVFGVKFGWWDTATGPRRVSVNTSTSRFMGQLPDTTNHSFATIEDASTWTLAQTFSVAQIFSSSDSGTVTQDNASFFRDDSVNSLWIGPTTLQLETSGTTARGGQMRIWTKPDGGAGNQAGN